MKKYTGIIYMYESPSGKYYIGQTTRPKSRKNEHAGMSYNNSELPFHRAIRKYGFKNLKYSVLCTITCNSLENLKDILNNLEKYYIVQYNCKVPNGYNVSDGGEGNLGIILSSESRKKMSIARQGHKVSNETRRKMSLWQIGKKLSEETKRKISKSCTGKICKGRSCIKLSIDNVELAEYSRIIDAAKDNNISQSAISMAISGKKKTAGGYKWKYKEEF